MAISGSGTISRPGTKMRVVIAVQSCLSLVEKPGNGIPQNPTPRWGLVVGPAEKVFGWTLNENALMDPVVPGGRWSDELPNCYQCLGGL
jgi:hypothetical protein